MKRLGLSQQLLERWVRERSSHRFRVTFSDAECYILEGLYPVDYSVYQKEGRWSAYVSGHVNLSEAKMKTHPLGSGLDFHLEEIVEIADDTSGEQLFPPRAT